MPPFPECQWAPEHVVLLIGQPVASFFRTDVQTTLTELQACTHLNDMLRCLAEVCFFSRSARVGCLSTERFASRQVRARRSR